MTTLEALRVDTLTRLGDREQVIWTGAEVDLHLRNAYEDIANRFAIWWNWFYAENLPAGFNYTEPWEQKFLLHLANAFNFGVANLTMEDERRNNVTAERDRLGPANHTSPFEYTDGFLSTAHASTDIPATAELPKELTALKRVTWDKRGLDAMEPRRLSRVDSRYEITKGEVYGYLWQKDGIRTLRKVRVPSQVADEITPAGTGTWGIACRLGTLTGDTIVGSWGIPRRVPGQHPLGPDYWGVPRRFFLDGKNVRVEYARQGRAMVDGSDVCELPDRYTLYLRDYAQGKCLERAGPGQDVKLAAHFAERWGRGLARIAKRLEMVDAERIVVLGGDGRPSVSRPPRPRLPWNFGTAVR